MFMPSNAFSSIVIDGLIKFNDVHTSLTCFRALSKPAKAAIPPIGFLRPEGVPARPPSKLPTPGEFSIHVSIEQEQLGYGRVGTVYPIRIDNPSQLSLPPLVIKVAGRHRSENLAREAWFYEEMEHLQGVAIARCYGFFSTEIDHNSEVLGWAESDAKYNPDEVDSQDDSEDTSDMAPHAPDSHPCEDKGDMEEGSISLTPASVGNEKTFVSVIVLERLGGLIPMDVPIDFTPDIFEIYHDIGRFGIEHNDVRWRNILEAPTTHDSLVCPHHGHTHQWRIVDFDRSKKSACFLKLIDAWHKSWLSPLLKGLPKGYVVEPWD